MDKQILPPELNLRQHSFFINTWLQFYALWRSEQVKAELGMRPFTTWSFSNVVVNFSTIELFYPGTKKRTEPMGYDEFLMWHLMPSIERQITL